MTPELADEMPESFLQIFNEPYNLGDVQETEKSLAPPDGWYQSTVPLAVSTITFPKDPLRRVIKFNGKFTALKGEFSRYFSVLASPDKREFDKKDGTGKFPDRASKVWASMVRAFQKANGHPKDFLAAGHEVISYIENYPVEVRFKTDGYGTQGEEVRAARI